MKTIFAWLILSLCILSAKAQTLTGKVYRAGTDTVIAGATVYYGGSIAATATNKQGEFTLTAKAQQVPVVVSCIGYTSATVNYTAGKPFIIYLQPKIEELHAVTIRADGMSREQELKIFTQEFIGTSAYAKSCVITNADDINLSYNAKTKTLTASCDKPIIIENKKLGYTVTYFLDKFSNTPDGLLFDGNYNFKDNLTAANADEIKRDREKAYNGSRMQFIRALWHINLKNSGFTISNEAGFQIDESYVVVRDSLKQKYIRWLGNINISHGWSNAFVSATNAPAFINKDGFYSTNLKWGGALTSQRIGDLLPFEYRSEKDPKETDTPSPSPGNQTTAAAAVVAKPNNQLVFEKTYLHTDRDVYALGDTLWFKAYLVNAQTNKPISSSGNLYVELIAPDSASILNREIIRINNGTGNGDFTLADSIPPGKYKLRAYTNWMRNFGDNFVFEKDITLLNTRAVPVLEAKITPSKNKKKPATIKPVTPTVTNTSAASAAPTVRFYPEGGSLVEGISSLVAVKAEDTYGKGTAVTGAVVSASGDTVTRFNCDTLGFGLFTLLPIKGQTYHAIAKFKHEAVFSLPLALSKGPAIHVKQTDSTLQVAIAINDTSGTGKPVYKIIIKHSGIALFSHQFQMPGLQGQVSVSTSTFPEGIAAVTLYDEKDKPNCEALVYIHRPANSPVAILATDKKTYRPQEKVNIRINAPANSTLSMAVVDAGIVPKQADDIVSYLMLQSEVKGNIEHASRYFDTTNVNRVKQLDLLLMTQGWRDFVWRRLADTAIRISYAAENSISLSGKVRDEIRNKYLPGVNISLFAPGARANDTKLFSTKTDSLGRFNVDGLMLYGTQNIRLAAIDDKGKDKGRFMVDTVSPLPLIKPVKKINNVDPSDSVIKIAVTKRITDMKNAHVGGIIQLNEVKIKTKQTVIMRDGLPWVIWGPDQVLNIKPEDEQYKTVEWYLLQNAKGAFQSVPPLEPTGVFFMGLVVTSHASVNMQGAPVALPGVGQGRIYPKIFINGVQLVWFDDTQAEVYRQIYFNAPIQKFSKIVIRRVVNGEADDYLLYLTLPENGMVDNPGMADMNISGYYQARQFYEPPQNGKPSLADYRTTIHWEPNIKTDATGKANISFYNALPQTNARIIVQGISADGNPITAVATYNINQVN